MYVFSYIKIHDTRDSRVLKINSLVQIQAPVNVKTAKGKQKKEKEKKSKEKPKEKKSKEKEKPARVRGRPPELSLAPSAGNDNTFAD